MSFIVDILSYSKRPSAKRLFMENNTDKKIIVKKYLQLNFEVLKQYFVVTNDFFLSEMEFIIVNYKHT